MIAGTKPVLLVIVDTEEEFDWAGAFSRDSWRIGSSIENLWRLQELLSARQVWPTYVVDYAIANDDLSVQTIGEFYQAGQCDIGAHLHPWINPPYVEELSVRNSFAGNLPRQVEADKLGALRDIIQLRFGVAPRVYRAGRYGIGQNTHRTLHELGFRIDSSVVPFTDFSVAEGPNFANFPADPFFHEGILQIPLTCGFVGAARQVGPSRYKSLSAIRRPLPLTGLLSRLKVLERCRLSPEQESLDSMIRLTRTLFREGLRVFCLSLHSSSLAPGGTPYVTSEADVAALLDRIDRYCRFFVRDFGGAGMRPLDVLDLLAPDARKAAA